MVAVEITLKEEKLSSEFKTVFADYYGALGVTSRYPEQKWQTWESDPNIIVYRAVENGEIRGWILLNRQNSSIEEILGKQLGAGTRRVALMLDALVARESLVSAEILREDTEKYRWLVDYGFRPTRHFRLHGFNCIGMELSTTVYFEKVRGKGPSKPYPDKERVAVEKVPETRTPVEIKSALKKVLNALGGLEKFLKKGQTVVIKPNVVADHGLRNGVYYGGVVTDIGLLKGLLEILLPLAGNIIIAEGSSINRAETMQLFKHYGYDTLLDLAPEKIQLVDLHQDKLVKKTVPRGKRMTSREIPVTFEKADVIINMPVMKTHFAALVSLSIKNLQGALPPLEKYMTHFFGLWQNLVNIHYLVKPNLIIMDALTAQEDFGPVYGTPKEMNLVLGGTNAVAVDAVAMRIMGLDPALSPPVQMAYLQGMGPMEPQKIEVLGASIDEVKRPFKEAEIDLRGGRDFKVHADRACSGCRGYLHYVLHKLRRPDPKNPDGLLIDRPFDKPVNLFLGPVTAVDPKPEDTNVFMGICQQHHAGMGKHLAGCPPHAEAIMKGIFSLFPDVERPQYADQNAEDKLEAMLKEILTDDYVEG
jgi:uncharacterized protein (DUF362 family)